MQIFHKRYPFLLVLRVNLSRYEQQRQRAFSGRSTSQPKNRVFTELEQSRGPNFQSSASSKGSNTLLSHWHFEELLLCYTLSALQENYSLSIDGLSELFCSSSSILCDLQCHSIPLTLPSFDQTLHAREEAVVKSCSAVISKILEEQRSEVGEADLEGTRIRVLNTVTSQRISFGHKEFDIRY